MPLLPLGQAPELVKAAYSPTGYRSTEKSPRTSFWQLHLYLYEGELLERDQWIRFAPGWMSLTPPGQNHEVHRPRRSPHYFVHFLISGRPQVPLPRCWLPQPEGESFTTVLARLVREAPLHPQRSRSRLWELLWRISEAPVRPAEQALPRGLDAALHYLEQDLDTPRPVAFLAERLGLSQGHLIRLFKKHLGLTPASWRRRRLAERAKLLLQESHLTPAQVAESLGLRDLQRFNKLMRREFGAAPRSLRTQT